MKKDTTGSSMVSVIVAFVILMLGMGMVYTSIMFSKNLTAKAVQVRKKTEGTMASYYENTGTAETKYVKFSLKNQEKSIQVGGRYIAYQAANGEMVYAFAASPGDGWHAADHILSDYEITTSTGGTALNEQLQNTYDPVNKNLFPPVTDEERAAAQNEIDRFSKKEGWTNIPQVPDGMVWKANVVTDEKTGKRSYYLWATTSTSGTAGWSAVLLCIDGQMYVSTNTNGNKTQVNGQMMASYNQAYTKEEMIKILLDQKLFVKIS